MRDDDRQTLLECLLAVGIVGCIGIECSDSGTGVNYCGRVDEAVPDFGCTYLRYTGVYFFLIKKKKIIMFND